MIMRYCRLLAGAGALCAGAPLGAVSAEPPDVMAAELAAIIALHGWPCDGVVQARPTEGQWASVNCRDGHVYEVLVGNDWDWRPLERQTRLQPMLELGNHSEQMTASDPASRRRAVAALGDLGPAAVPAVPALTRALTDDDVSVRQAAAEALGKIGARAAVPALTEALRDPDSDVRNSAADALAAIGGS